MKCGLVPKAGTDNGRAGPWVRMPVCVDMGTDLCFCCVHGEAMKVNGRMSQQRRWLCE